MVHCASLVAAWYIAIFGRLVLPVEAMSNIVFYIPDLRLLVPNLVMCSLYVLHVPYVQV